MEKLLALGEPEMKQNWLDCSELEIGPEHVEDARACLACAGATPRRSGGRAIDAAAAANR